ncbi:acetyl-CoA C-acetyltransferase [Bacteroidota bacterium]
MRKVVITAAKRTPIGSFLGKLSSLNTAELGKVVINGIITESEIDPNQVDEVIMGNILNAGVGQAPARQAAILAGLSTKVECLTINKMCGSGLKAVMLADLSIKCRESDVIIAGGMESMSNAPHLLPRSRTGYRLGNVEIIDSMIRDGLWDVYNNIHMGSCAETCAKNFGFTRQELDEYAIMSYRRTLDAQSRNVFDDEIVEVPIKLRKENIKFDIDEEPGNVKFEKIPKLKPAFERDGLITAANASKINDGSAALLVMSEERALELGCAPLVEIVAHSSAAKDPIDFPIAPVDAIQNVLNKSSISIEDIDLFEINEAFAVVSLAVNNLLKLSVDKVNINGGAIALGHPIGASGARILVTLIHQMMKKNYKYGLASLCIGGGEASAMIVKKYNY